MKRLHAGCLIAAFLAVNAYGWGATAHRIINGGAVVHLPSTMQLFIDQQSFFQSHASDADNRKSSDSTEAMKHFIDIDNYADFTTMTHDYDSAVATHGLSTVEQNGIVPWAALWAFDSLIAQLQRGDWTLAYQTAADLGHYVGDGNMALHATRNYNGQLTGDTGIHSRYETTMINNFQQQMSITKETISLINHPIDTLFACVIHVNSYADSIMAADKRARSVSGWNGTGTAPSAYYTELWNATQSFTKAHIQRASVVLAGLWYTAWVHAGLLPVTAGEIPWTVVASAAAAGPSARLPIFDARGRRIPHVNAIAALGAGGSGAVLLVHSPVAGAFYRADWRR